MSARLQRFFEGTGWDAYKVLGAHAAIVSGDAGFWFRVWAPRAEAVSVVGEFSGWEPIALARRPDFGAIWQGFVPGVEHGALYKYRVHGCDGETTERADPFAFWSEVRPATASRTYTHRYRARAPTDRQRRAGRDPAGDPIAIYELHLGSWRRHPDGRMYTYRELGKPIVEHVGGLGFTHVELLPVSEHPYDPSWGYQCLGYFAPTSRHGTPDELRALIARLHAAGLGVILDWVPAHFPRDGHGLARFDGAPLFEYADPRLGEHPDWGTLVFDYARPEVRSFLLSSACFWLDRMGVDGLRVDAVASMIYLDYSREEGQWIPNEHGGREHLSAISWLQDLNRVVQERFEGALIFAEESTSFPRVSGPPPPPFSPHDAGLGFSFKWNMGWMHDVLSYFGAAPDHRPDHHDRATFPAMYAFAERFVLPLSHDEVVHGKGSLLRKMGGEWPDGAPQLALLLLWQWTWPGKKLLFSGGEFGQEAEWDADRELDWAASSDPWRADISHLVARLNALYRQLPALHRGDCDPRGFRWIDWEDRARCVFTWVRADPGASGPAAEVCVVVSLSGRPLTGFVLEVPSEGAWQVALDAQDPASLRPWATMRTKRGAAKLTIDLPAWAGLVLVRQEVANGLA